MADRRIPVRTPPHSCRAALSPQPLTHLVDDRNDLLLRQGILGRDRALSQFVKQRPQRLAPWIGDEDVNLGLSRQIDLLPQAHHRAVPDTFHALHGLSPPFSAYPL